MPDYITDHEMTRWMDEQHKFRERLERRLGEQHQEIVGRLVRIEDQVRETNGRTRKAEACIAVEDREIEAIKTNLQRIDRYLSSDAPIDTGRPLNWPVLTTKQKTAIGGGVLVALSPALVELVKGGITFLQWAGGMR